MRYQSEKEAIYAAERYRRCPKVYFWGNKKKEAYIILRIPEENKYWSDYIAEYPESSFGGVAATLIYLEELFVPTNIEVNYDKIPVDTSPCGSRCRACPSYGQCSGCPSLNLDTL
jgi:hypothetical protein